MSYMTCMPEPIDQDKFNHFTKAIAELSRKYGIALQEIRGRYIDISSNFKFKAPTGTDDAPDCKAAPALYFVHYYE